VDHSTLNRWVLAYAPLIERRLWAFRKPHCGSLRIGETYIKIRGQWRYLYRAIDKHGTTDDPGVRGHAVAAEGVRLCRRLDSMRAEPVLLVCFGLPAANKA
jgi:transposase, IS6 family